MKMFQKIQELIDDKDALVCVLIDEVFWSYTYAQLKFIHINMPANWIELLLYIWFAFSVVGWKFDCSSQVSNAGTGALRCNKSS